MLELLRGMFRRLLRELPKCGEECHGEGELRCDRPAGLTEGGAFTTDVDGGDCVVRWPGCPQRWFRLRQWGADLLPLSEIVRWEYERGLHLRRGLPWASERLLREYAVRREEPDVLAMRRRAAEAT